MRVLLIVAALLMPVPKAGFGQTSFEWPVTVHQVSGNLSNCSPGGRGTIKVTNNIMSFFAQGQSFPNWKLELAADGSADKIVPYEGSTSRTVKIMVAAGSGPREVETIPQRVICRYRLIPG